MRFLQPNNITTMCQSLTETAASLPSLQMKLYPPSFLMHLHYFHTVTKFMIAVHFSQMMIYIIYVKNYSLTYTFMYSFLSEAAIDTFLRYNHLHFPSATVLPKMHFMEHHILPWVRQWQVSSGLMGEQGAESLHTDFNHTERAYNNMERLRVVLQSLHLKTLPCI